MKNNHNIPFILLTLFLAATLVYKISSNSVQPTPLKKSFKEFPHNIGEFQLESSQVFNENVVKTAGMDYYLMNQYKNDVGSKIWLYIGYYTDQTEGSIIHSPRHCLPGSGWEFLEIKSLKITGINQKEYAINQVIQQKGSEKQLIHYWYHGRGRIVANEYVDRTLMIIDSIIKKRSDGALIRISGPFSSPDKDIKEQVKFIEDLLGIVNNFIP